MCTDQDLAKDQVTQKRIVDIGLLMEDAFGCREQMLVPEECHDGRSLALGLNTLVRRAKYLWTPVITEAWPQKRAKLGKIVVNGTLDGIMPPSFLPIRTVDVIHEELDEKTNVKEMTRFKCWSNAAGHLAKLKRIQKSNSPLYVEFPSLEVSMVTLSLTVPYALTENKHVVETETWTGKKRSQLVFRIGANPNVNNRRVQNYARLWLEDSEASKQNKLPGLIQTLENSTGDKALSISQSDVVTVAFQAETPRETGAEHITPMTAIHTIQGITDDICRIEQYGYGLDLANVNRMWLAFYETTFDTLAGDDDELLQCLGSDVKAMVGFRALIDQLNRDFHGFETDASIFKFFSFVCGRYNRLHGSEVFPTSYQIPEIHARAIAWHRAKLIVRTKYFFGRCGSAFLEGNGRCSAVAYAMADIFPPLGAVDISEPFQALNDVKLSKCVEHVKWHLVFPLAKEPFGPSAVKWMTDESAAIQHRNESFASRSIVECIQQVMDNIEKDDELSIPVDVRENWSELSANKTELAAYITWSQHRETEICGYLQAEFCKPVMEMVNDVYLKANAQLKQGETHLDKQDALLKQKYIHGDSSVKIVSASDSKFALAALIRFFMFAGMKPGGPSKHAVLEDLAFFTTIREFLTINGRANRKQDYEERYSRTYDAKLFVPALDGVQANVSPCMLRSHLY